MTEEQFKSYIDTIKDHPKFKKLDKFIKMTKLLEDKDIYENIIYYVNLQCYKTDENGLRRIPDYEYFKRFMDEYLKDEKEEVLRFDKEGNLDLGKTLFLKQPLRLAGSSGNFFDGWLVMTDDSKYISKLPLGYRGNSGIGKGNSRYIPIISSYIAKQLNIDTAEYRFAKLGNGQTRIISPSFLNENEEIITYSQQNSENPMIARELDILTENLTLRKFSEEEIEKAKFEFLKQEFLAKIIDLKDQKPENSPLILSVDRNGERHIRLAPMTDYDYSFNIAPMNSMLPQRRCNNGKKDISSLIEQYKDYPGFKEFVEEAIDSFNMRKVYAKIYEDTGIPEFKDYENDERMVRFIEFAENNMKEAKETFDKLYRDERGDK